MLLSHYYGLTSARGTWDAAEAEAVSYGGHLASITSRDEQDFITSRFISGGNASTPYWIGGTDREHEGVFKWVNGDLFDFTNWNPQEPNALFGEDYIVINWHKSHNRLNSQFGDWNDAPFNGTSSGFLGHPEDYWGIIEFNTPPSNFPRPLLRFDGPFDPDPDDELSEATALGRLDATVDGVIDVVGDVDMYSFEALGGVRLGFDIDTESNGVPGLGSYLRIFDSAGQQLASNNDARAPGEPVLGFDAFIDYTFPQAGTYYVGVSSWLNTNYSPHTGAGDSRQTQHGTGAYTLRVGMPEPPVVAGGFDYPVGWPDAQPRSDAGWHTSLGFGDRNHRVSGRHGYHHLGEDWNYGGGSDDVGKPVHAIADGVVVFAGAPPEGGWGGAVILRHRLPDGSQIESLYGHINPASLAHGALVRRGQEIGSIGLFDGIEPHLHFEIRSPQASSGVAGHGYSWTPRPSGWIDPSDFIESRRAVGVSRATPQLLPAPTGARKLVVVTHGRMDNADGWVTRMAQAIRHALERNGTSGEWDVWTYDWREDAYFDGINTFDLARLVANARARGAALGRVLAGDPFQYDTIHFLGHSAGAQLIDAATDKIRSIDPTIRLHDTFFDAFQRAGTDDTHYGPLGDHADWADHYVNVGDWPYTDNTLPFAYNVDVTAFDPYEDNLVPAVKSFRHGWPHAWYLFSVVRPNNTQTSDREGNAWGFARAAEHSGTSPGSGSPPGVQPGTLIPLSHTSNGGFSRGDLSNWSVSGPGTAVVIPAPGDESNRVVEVIAGSPVTLSQTLDTPGRDYVISFDWRFLDPGSRFEVLLNAQVIGTTTAADVPQDAFDSSRFVVTDPALKSLPAATLAIRFDGPSGSRALLDNVAIDPIDFELILGSGGANSITYTDGDGTVATVKLLSGTATVLFDGERLQQAASGRGVSVWGANARIASVALIGDAGKAALSFSVKRSHPGADGLVTVNSITSASAIKSVTAKAVKLTQQLTVGGDADSPPVTLNLGQLSEASIVSGAPIKTLTALEWLDRDGIVDALIAPGVGALHIKGDPNASSVIRGDLEADVVTTEATFDFKKLTVAGVIGESNIRVAGNLKSVTAGAMVAARVFAGVIGDAIPDDQTDFDSFSLGTVTIKGVAGLARASFIQSSLAAARIGAVKLKDVDGGDGSGPDFGLAAGTIKSFQRLDQAGLVKLSNLNTPGDADADPDDDFVIRIF